MKILTNGWLALLAQASHAYGISLLNMRNQVIFLPLSPNGQGRNGVVSIGVWKHKVACLHEQI
jgi:hypothetical protein